MPLLDQARCRWPGVSAALSLKGTHAEPHRANSPGRHNSSDTQTDARNQAPVSRPGTSSQRTVRHLSTKPARRLATLRSGAIRLAQGTQVVGEVVRRAQGAGVALAEYPAAAVRVSWSRSRASA
jgi:hypothetical protein